MSDPLGLSVGATNLVAVRAGHPPVARSAVRAPLDHRPPEVSTADALDALGRTVGYGAPVWVAVPSYWDAAALDALHAALRAKPGLAPDGVGPTFVPDTAAAVTALRAQPGLPSGGVVVLCDFGGSGTSITLLDAGADFTSIGPTVRHTGFAGDRIDEAIIDHLLTRPGLSTAESTDTAAAGSLVALREACRSAKERLSEQTSTAVAVDLPGLRSELQLTRSELEALIAAPLTGVVDTVLDAVARSGVAADSLTAAAMIGGGAHIPAVGAQLTERLRVPVITVPQPEYIAATGAQLLASRPPPVAAGTQDRTAADTPTSMASAAWAAAAGQESAADGGQSATFRALAWSQDDSKAYEPVPYAGADYGSGAFDYGAVPDRDDDIFAPAEPAPLSWYKRPVVLFGLAAALALTATGGLVYTLTGKDSPAGDSTGVSTPGQPAGPESPQPAAPPVTVTITGSDGATSLSTLPPPPPASTTTTTSDVTTTTTTTTQPTTTTTTTTQPTTSTAPTTTTHATTTAPTTTAAPSPTSEPPSPQPTAPPTTAPTGGE